MILYLFLWCLSFYSIMWLRICLCWWNLLIDHFNFHCSVSVWIFSICSYLPLFSLVWNYTLHRYLRLATGIPWRVFKTNHYFYLKFRMTESQGQTERSYICFFTPPMATTARTGPGLSQQPGPASNIPEGWQKCKDLGCLVMLSLRISRQVDQEWSIWDSGARIACWPCRWSR